MEAKQQLITPKLAEKFLDRNTSNRKLREGVAEKYADDMKQGKWTECPVPICFYENGDVADGQHRLWAIIDSGVPQKFFVVHNLSREAGLNLDTGLNRTLVDNARISGVDTDITNELLAVVRACEEGDRQSQGSSNARKLEFVNKHREAGKWALAHGPRGRGLRNSMVLAALARAWYHEEDKERLAKFAVVMSTGFMEADGDGAAIALRNYLLPKATSTLGRMGRTPIGSSRDTFLKAMNAVSYFMRQKKLTLIKTVKEEAYPLKKRKGG